MQNEATVMGEAGSSRFFDGLLDGLRQGNPEINSSTTYAVDITCANSHSSIALGNKPSKQYHGCRVSSPQPEKLYSQMIA